MGKLARFVLEVLKDKDDVLIRAPVDRSRKQIATHISLGEGLYFYGGRFRKFSDYQFSKTLPELIEEIERISPLPDTYDVPQIGLENADLLTVIKEIAKYDKIEGLG